MSRLPVDYDDILTFHISSVLEVFNSVWFKPSNVEISVIKKNHMVNVVASDTISNQGMNYVAETDTCHPRRRIPTTCTTFLLGNIKKMHIHI